MAVAKLEDDCSETDMSEPAAQEGVARPETLRDPPVDETAPKPAAAPRRAVSRRFRLLWLATGWFFFAIGFVGVFLPVLPTTGFWILAAIAFERSHPAIAERIRNWPRFGPPVAAFLDHGVISRSGKIAALSAMALSALVIVLFVHGVGFWAGLGGIAVGALFVSTRPSVPASSEAAKRGAAGSI